MNNKFIRVLIIINGILIPCFILLIIGNIIKEEYSKRGRFNSQSDFSERSKPKYEIKRSSIIKVPNSENYMVAEYKRPIDDFVKTEEKIYFPYEVPDDTFNIIFLDKNYNQKRKLLEKDGDIASMFISNAYTNNKELISKIHHLSFYIATEDTNSDGKINVNDQHYVYLSNLDGSNLVKVTDRIVKQYEWINDNNELLLTFVNDKNDDLEQGIYNIENKTLTDTESLK